MLLSATRNGRWFCRIVVISCLAFLPFSITSKAQNASGVIVTIGFSSIGTISEIISTPYDGRNNKDRNWIYEWLENGQRVLPQRSAINQSSEARPSANHVNSEVFANIPTTAQPADTGTEVSAGHLLFSMDIDAAKVWQKSGFNLVRGKKYLVEVSGKWSMHLQERWCDGNGIFSDSPLSAYASTLPGHPSPYCPLPDGLAGVLAGRIGNTGQPFPIGTGKRLTAQDSGEMEFMANDIYDNSSQGQPCQYCGDPQGHIWNNSGTLKVSVSEDSD
ncbi:MAG: hypothetical protein HQM10_08225 [Candidatus Riflebacteria bacterium]|nr:hypothetical protein [Candidatus Riflebacteria bacterium]